MTQELFYTSAERGLDMGTSGFCTVKRTRGLSKRLERLLHELSVYKAIYPPHHPQFSHNPVLFMHCRANLDGQMISIVSRICAAPLDYSGRSNYFAHHLVLNPTELPPAGPVWLVKQPGLFASQWDGQVAELPAGRSVPQGNNPPRPCTTWQRVTGDAGWAGVVLRYWLENSAMPFYLIADDNTPILDLLDEAVALLPDEKRWSATFTTQYNHLPSGVTCTGRVVFVGSEKIGEAKASSRCLDLTTLRNKRPPDDPYTQAARTGRTVQVTTSYLLAEDEPALPPSPQSFSQVQVAGPIRRNPGISPVPPAPVPVAPPPPVSQPPDRSRTPLWVRLAMLLQLALTIGLAISVVLMFQSLQHKVGQLRSEAHQKLGENEKAISEKLGYLADRAQIQKLEAELRDAMKEVKAKVSKEELKNAGDVISKRLNDLDKRVQVMENHPEKLTEGLKEIVKHLAEQHAASVAKAVAKDLESAGLSKKIIEEEVANRVKEGITKLYSKVEHRPWHLPAGNQTKDGGATIVEGEIRKVAVYAPNATVAPKTKVLERKEMGKDEWHVDNDLVLRLTLEERKLMLRWDPKKAKPQDLQKSLRDMTLVIFCEDRILFYYYAPAQRGGQKPEDKASK